MEAVRFEWLQRLSNGIELLSSFVLLVGFAKGMWGFLLIEFDALRSRQTDDTHGLIAALRPMVGSYILLGLDFYIVSDIIATMLHPEMNELLSLVVIGLLRTAIGFFLGKEIEKTGSGN